jgi:multisubunit Na+/H+ antiporter MnhE subunit
MSLVISDQHKWRSLLVGGVTGVGIIGAGWFMLVMERIVYEWIPLYLFFVLLAVAIINAGRKWRKSLKQEIPSLDE